MNLLDKITFWRGDAKPARTLPSPMTREEAERAASELPAALRAHLGLGDDAPRALFDRSWLQGAIPDGILVQAFRYAFAPLARSLPREPRHTHGPVLAALARWRSEEVRATLEWMRDEMLRAQSLPRTSPAWTENAVAGVSKPITEDAAGGPLTEYGRCDIWADGEVLAEASNALHALAAGREDEALAATPQEATDLHRVFELWYGLNSHLACAYREWRYACDEFRLLAGLVQELPPEEVPIFAAVRAALDHPVEHP